MLQFSELVYFRMIFLLLLKSVGGGGMGGLVIGVEWGGVGAYNCNNSGHCHRGHSLDY